MGRRFLKVVYNIHIIHLCAGLSYYIQNVLIISCYLHVFPRIILCYSTVIPACSTTSYYQQISYLFFCFCVSIVVIFLYFQTAWYQKACLINSPMNCCPAWDVSKAARMQFRQSLKELWNEFLTTKKKVYFLHDNSMQCVFIAEPPWSWSYGSWIYNYMCNQRLSQLKLWVRIPLMAKYTRYKMIR